MRLTRMQIRNQIRNLLRESVAGNPIAGFGLAKNSLYTNEDLKALGVEEAWWWAQAAAVGLWFAEDEAKAKLKGRFDEYQRNFDEEFNSDRPAQANVEAGVPEIKYKGKKRIRSLFKRKGEEDQMQAKKERQPAKASFQPIAQYRNYDTLTQIKASDAYGNNYDVFGKLVDRYIIAKQMQQFDEAEAAKMMNLVLIDIEDMTDVTSYDGPRRYKYLRAQVEAAGNKINRQIRDINNDLREKINDGIGKQDGNIVIKAGEDAGGISGEIRGNKAEQMVYTIPGDKTYVYIKSDSSPNGWQFALKKDYLAKKDMSVFKNIRDAGAENLNNDLKDGKLAGNPMSSLKESRNLNRMQIRRLVRNILSEQTGMPSNYDPTFRMLVELCEDLGQNCEGIEDTPRGRGTLIQMIRKACGK